MCEEYKQKYEVSNKSNQQNLGKNNLMIIWVLFYMNITKILTILIYRLHRSFEKWYSQFKK